MKTKTFALFTLAAALFAGAALTFAANEERAVVPVAESTIAADCEFLVTPHGTTVLKDGVSC